MGESNASREPATGPALSAADRSPESLAASPLLSAGSHSTGGDSDSQAALGSQAGLGAQSALGAQAGLGVASTDGVALAKAASGSAVTKPTTSASQSPSQRLASIREGKSTQITGAGVVQPPSQPDTTARLDPLLDPRRMDEEVTIISSRGPLDDSGSTRGLAPLEVGRRLEGERLGQFVLIKFVGGGGMGAVFRALDTTLNREVAVKVLSRFQSDEEETLRRFRNEAQSAARLDHGNIARVYYVGYDRGLHYIVFEYIEGENMRDLVDRRGPLPVVEAVSYTLQIAEALSHASQRDVIHRDIKPSNMIVTPEGKAKLVDMGLARLHVDHPDQDITASGVTLGTFDYISPEQARDPRSADVRSDLYSLGCSLFFMLTGRPPFPHGTVLQKLLQHQGDEPPDARQSRPDLPSDLHRILARLLAKDPDDRFQTPGDLIQELIGVGRALGWQAPSSVNVDWTLPVERPIAWWEKHLPWFVPLVTLLLVVAGLDYFWSNADARMRAGNMADDSRGAIAPASATDGNQRSGVRNTTPQPSATAVASAPAANADADAARTAKATVAPAERTSGGSTGGSTAGSGASDSTAAAGNRPAATTEQSPSIAAGAGANHIAAGAAAPGEAKSTRESTGDVVRTARRSGSGPSGEYVSAGGNPTSAVPPRPDAAARGASASRTGEASVRSSALGDISPMPMPGVPAGATVANEDPPVEPAPRAGLLIVGQGDNRAPSFETLSAALAVAKSGDVIELRYNGVLEESPIRLTTLKVTIRAGERYSPAVRFRVDASARSQRDRRMITLSGGQLSVIHVDWEVDASAMPVGGPWAFCSVRRAEMVRFERSTLTLREPLQADTAEGTSGAFFRIEAPSGVEPTPNDSQIDGRVVELQIQNCIARGGATFLQVVDGEGVRMGWHNGFLATSQKMLLMSAPPQPRQIAPVEIDVQHLTAITRGGFALVDASDRAGDVGSAVHVAVADSIVALPAMASAPLVEQRFIDRAAESRSRLQWSGDRNFYQGFDVFWKVESLGAETALELSHADWEAVGGRSREYLCHSGGVRWQASSAPTGPFDALTPADYALLPDGRMNPAVESASDGRDVGFLAESLPSLGAASAAPAKEIPLRGGPAPETTPEGRDSEP